MSTSPRIQAAKKDWGHDESGCNILHIDMDAFYASLEIARHPELATKPVVIGTGTRSVVSAANYEARKYGINSAMPVARAKQLCPHAIFLPVDMRYYKHISQQIFTTIIENITDKIEQISVDECFINVQGALLIWKKPTVIAQWIRKQIYESFAITCSVGIASNKLIAKIASTNAKPNGMLLIPQAQNANFIQMMPLRAIPGIGPALEQKLEQWGIHNVAQLAQTSEQTLLSATRSKAQTRYLINASKGIDNSKLTYEREEKSIGHEQTFMQDTTSIARISKLIHECCERVSSTLRVKQLCAKTLHVKIRYADLTYTTRSYTLKTYTNSITNLYPVCISLLESILKTPPITQENRHILQCEKKVRLAGISVSNLQQANTAHYQPTFDLLFENAHEEQRQRQKQAEQTLDTIRKKYGPRSASFGL